MKNLKGFPMMAEAKDAIEILKMDKTMIASVAARRSATKWGLTFLLVPAALNLIFAALSFPSGFTAIFSRFVLWPAVIPVLAFVGGLYLLHVAAEKVFHAKADFWGFFRVMSYAYLISWLALIPAILIAVGVFAGGGLGSLISMVASIWMLVVAYHVLIDYYKLNQQNAILTLIIGGIAYFILASILGTVLVGSYFRMYY